MQAKEAYADSHTNPSTPDETLQLVIDVINIKEHLMKDETFDDRWANVGELIKVRSNLI